jgi:predicted aconitase with swiveling domain
MAETIEIKCRGLVKGKAEGEALVAPATLSFWGEVDPVSGRVIAAGHPLEGRLLRDKVLVIRSTKGSSGTPFVMGLAHAEGNAPAALVNTHVDCLAVLGCVVNRIPMVADLEQDPFEIVKTGDHVLVNADEGKIVVTREDLGSYKAIGR